MRWLYLSSVFLHLLCAIVWLGGMGFLGLALVPVLRDEAFRKVRAQLIGGIGMRFRTVGWVCLVLILATGIVNLLCRGYSLAGIFRGEAFVGGLGHLVLGKLLLFVAIVVLSGIHDFSIGPRAAVALADNPDGPLAQRLRKQASVMGRLNALLALVVVILAVMIVRGTP